MGIFEVLMKLLSKIFSFKTKGNISLSFDDRVKLKDIPVGPLLQVGKFVEFNKELVHFEITEINSITKKIKICEICTDNEFELDFDFFEYLFHETPVPDECKF